MIHNSFSLTNEIMVNACEEAIERHHLAENVPSRVMMTIIREELAERLGMTIREFCDRVAKNEMPPKPEEKEILADEFALGGYILRDKKTGDYLARTSDGSVAFTTNPMCARTFDTLEYAMGFRKNLGWEVFKRVSLTMEKVDTDGYENALKKYQEAKAELERFG